MFQTGSNRASSKNSNSSSKQTKHTQSTISISASSNNNRNNPYVYTYGIHYDHNNTMHTHRLKFNQSDIYTKKTCYRYVVCVVGIAQISFSMQNIGFWFSSEQTVVANGLSCLLNREIILFSIYWSLFVAKDRMFFCCIKSLCGLFYFSSWDYISDIV